MAWKPDKSHCCMFLFSLYTIRLKFDRVFVAMTPAIFTLSVSLLAAWSLISVLLSSSDSDTAIVSLQL